MSTILEPCFESQLIIETATVKLKVAPSKSLEFGRNNSCLAATDAMEHKEKCHQPAMDFCGNASAKTDLGRLSFQQVLSNICSSTKETMEKEPIYVHPLSKRSSSSRLSEKSFEMCTENLGSETGTDIMDSSILSLTPSMNFTVREKLSPPREYSKNKVNSRNFPPPLTTISGANSLQVRPHREGGRLVIRAVETPVKHTYLRAERSHGRLRLCLLKDHATKFDSQLTAEENEVDSDEEVEVDVVENNDSYTNDEDLQENEELEDQKEDEDDDDESDAHSKDTDGNNFDIEVDKGMEKFQRLSRCNQGRHSNKVLHNWEPLWVATS